MAEPQRRNSLHVVQEEVTEETTSGLHRQHTASTLPETATSRHTSLSTANDGTNNHHSQSVSPPASEPPQYTVPPPSPSPSPPPPPLPPSPVLLPHSRTCHVPSFSPPPLPPSHSILLDIFPDAPPTDEPLPAYSRFPKSGIDTAIPPHLLNDDPERQTRSRRIEHKTIYGIKLRNLATALTIIILAGLIVGVVMGWQLKTRNDQWEPNGGNGGNGQVGGMGEFDRKSDYPMTAKSAREKGEVDDGTDRFVRADW